MELLWFCLVAIMLTGYVILDGFDLGAGALYLLIARTEEQRRILIRTIGPVWDANEVWLLAAGGTLYFAFPLLYASSFSGFYLPLNIVLWLLILRGLGVEFRQHIDNRIWRSLFDFSFTFSSTLLAVFFGAALGNVIRGVPLDSRHVFFEPLWTNFKTSGNTGILDWYTIGAGVFALLALVVHGCLYIGMKTEGDLNERARGLAALLIPVLMLLTVPGVPVTAIVRSRALDNYRHYPVLFLFPAVVALSVIAMWWCNRTKRESEAFAASCAYLGSLLAGAAAAMYPSLLPSTGDPDNSITVYNAVSGAYALRVGLLWWIPGMCLALGYFVFLYRMFRGKVISEKDQGAESGHSYS